MGESLLRVIKISAIVFLLVLGAIGVSARLSGDSRELPFEYEGYD
jgi:hypothetical protein